jgi:hypothetical protein
MYNIIYHYVIQTRTADAKEEAHPPPFSDGGDFSNGSLALAHLPIY